MRPGLGAFDQDYYCWHRYRKPIAKNLESFWLPEDSGTTKPEGDSTVYVCSMDPDVRQDHPGSCPRCGMSLNLLMSSRLLAKDPIKFCQQLEIIGDALGDISRYEQTERLTKLSMK